MVTRNKFVCLGNYLANRAAYEKLFEDFYFDKDLGIDIDDGKINTETGAVKEDADKIIELCFQTLREFWARLEAKEEILKLSKKEIEEKSKSSLGCNNANICVCNNCIDSLGCIDGIHCLAKMK